MVDDLESVNLTSGQVLCEQGGRLTHAYFPAESLISLVTSVQDDRVLEAAVVGHEGMVGVALGSGVAQSLQRAVVQAPGRALRMEAARFRKHLAASSALREQIQGYTYALMTEIAWTAACNNYHPVEGRLARRLLIMRDRARSAQFHLTARGARRHLGRAPSWRHRSGVRDATSQAHLVPAWAYPHHQSRRP